MTKRNNKKQAQIRLERRRKGKRNYHRKGTGKLDWRKRTNKYEV